MATAFSVISWNVERFGTKGDDHTQRILDKVTEHAPDLCAFYETRPSALWLDLMERMPGYAWYITEGHQSQETLLGIRHGITAFVTQRVEFKTRDAYYRPGLLATVLVDDVAYPVVFLHLASMRDAKGFGRRQEQIDAAFDFKATLDKASPGSSANYLFVGDLNAMGLDFKYNQDAPGRPYERVEVSFERELERIEFLASRSAMRVLSKTHEHTWRNHGGTRSNLDHIVAADHLAFTTFGGADVLVDGWVDEPTNAAQRDWIAEFSDHSLLYFEVEKV